MPVPADSALLVGVKGFEAKGGPTAGLAQLLALGGHCGYLMEVLKLVGRNVPEDVIFPPILLPESAKVRLIGEMPESLLPVSEKKSRLLPPGPTSRERRSPWSSVLNPFSVTVTESTVPGRLVTKMFEGYGAAAPASRPRPGAVIAPALQYEYGPAPDPELGIVVALSTRWSKVPVLMPNSVPVLVPL